MNWGAAVATTTTRARLTRALVVLLLIWCAAAAAMLAELSRIHARAERVAVEHLPRLERANALIDLANETARTLGEMLLARQANELRAGRQRILTVRAQATGNMRWFHAQPAPGDVHAMLAAMDTLRTRYWAAQDVLFRMIDATPAAARAYYLDEVLAMQRAYVHATGRLIQRENAMAAASVRQTRDDYERALYLLLACSCIALLLAGTLGMQVLRSVTAPLEAAAALARSVAQGNLDVDLASRRHDEVGQLTAALTHMARSLRDDRAKRQATEQELRASRTRLRELAAHAESLQERERLTLARELHDELGQSLTAVRLELAMLRMRFSHLDPALGAQIAQAKATVDAMLRTMRGVVAELRPGPLDTGLVPATEWLLANLARRSGLRTTLHAPPGDLPLEHAVRTAAFRILQEALTNVARHAQARSVRVAIALQDDGRLLLEVADDGVGAEMASVRAGRTFGLLGMHERALMFGGDLHCEPTEGGGFTLRAVLETRGKLDT